MEDKNILKQLNFIVETDKLKTINRKSSPIGESRRENSAEHSWQVALSALILNEHSNQEVDILQVIQMLLIHDVVEIDVGDVMHHHKDRIPDLKEKEEIAAKRIFGLLPKDQGEKLLAIWREFEERNTPESRFAAAVDRLIAPILNSNNKGGTWKEFNLDAETVTKNNQHIEEGSSAMWEIAKDIFAEAKSKQYLR